MLTVISIIGLLMALLLPAVQQAREAGRRNTCKNNLRQIGVGLLNLESAHGHFPSGGWGYQWYGDPDRGAGLAQPGGWAFSILSYLERKDLATYGAGQSGQKKLAALAQTNATPLSVYYCPSRRSAGTYPFDMNWPPRNTAPMSVAAKCDYAINGGDVQLNSGGGPNSYAQGDDPTYAWPSSSKGSGVCYFHTVIAPAQIKDGLSLTYLAGEKNVFVGGFDLGDDQSSFVGYDLDNTRWTTLGWTPVPDGSAPNYERFGGPHPGVCEFVFCDGSVRDINYSIDAEIHRRLGNRHDGKIIDDAQFK